MAEMSNTVEWKLVQLKIGRRFFNFPEDVFHKKNKKTRTKSCCCCCVFLASSAASHPQMRNWIEKENPKSLEKQVEEHQRGGGGEGEAAEEDWELRVKKIPWRPFSKIKNVFKYHRSVGPSLSSSLFFHQPRVLETLLFPPSTPQASQQPFKRKCEEGERFSFFFKDRFIFLSSSIHPQTVYIRASSSKCL